MSLSSGTTSLLFYFALKKQYYKFKKSTNAHTSGKAIIIKVDKQLQLTFAWKKLHRTRNIIIIPILSYGDILYTLDKYGKINGEIISKGKLISFENVIISKKYSPPLSFIWVLSPMEDGSKLNFKAHNCLSCFYERQWRAKIISPCATLSKNLNLITLR